ncbi:ATP-dependent DNA helicase MER3 [Dimargaris xerosporica]|nr:ATP-dependent DNA helicase MER3 [Dimargaris xerosporica]
MRMVNPMMRIVAISATIPNIHDIAQWLGASPTNLPPGDGDVQPLASVQGATVKAFGDEYRPVPLFRHVIGFESSGDNYFLFEKRLDYQLPDIIAQYANGKPALVSAQQSAEYLAKHMKTHAPETLNKSAPPDWCMNHFITESCVNLPAHLVIVKGTRAYANSKYAEYSNLDILQMMGRAGRPQFDTSGVAVILTTQDRVIQYEQVVSGHQPIESSDPKLGHQMVAEMRTIVLQAYRILKCAQYAKALSAAGIKSLDDLKNTEPRKIEMIVGRNPPFGNQAISSVKQLPWLQLTAQKLEHPEARRQDCDKPQWVTFIAYTRSQQLVDFRRFTISYSAAPDRQFLVPIPSTVNNQEEITCMVLCEDIRDSVAISLADFSDATGSHQQDPLSPLKPQPTAVESASNSKCDARYASLVIHRVATSVVSPAEPCQHKCQNKHQCKHTCCKQGRKRKHLTLPSSKGHDLSSLPHKKVKADPIIWELPSDDELPSPSLLGVGCLPRKPGTSHQAASDTGWAVQLPSNGSADSTTTRMVNQELVVISDDDSDSRQVSPSTSGTPRKVPCLTHQLQSHVQQGQSMFQRLLRKCQE